MAYNLTRANVQQLRLQAQRLLTPASGAVAALVSSMGALQAQEKPAALLAARPRLPGVTAATLTAALEENRTVVRTWCLRGTLHLVTSEDVRWLLQLVAPRVLKNSQRRYRELGLDEQTLAQATDLVTEALRAEGSLTRAEVGAYLERHQVDVEGQRLPHLLRRAALLGLICLGPDRDGVETYVLLPEWVDTVDNTAEGGWKVLAGRYLDAYGPVGVDDFVTWAGAYKRDAQTVLAAHHDALAEVEVEGEVMHLPEQRLTWLAQATAAEPTVHLLPAYDPLLLGYRSREWLVAPQFKREIHPGGGFLRPTLLVNGEAAGTWRVKQQTSRLQVEVTPFATLTQESTRLLAAEVADLGRFWEKDTELVVSAFKQTA